MYIFEKKILTVMKIKSILLAVVLFLIVGFLTSLLFVNADPVSKCLFGNVDNRIGELLKMFLQTIGGLFVILALYYTIRRTKALELNTKSFIDSILISERGQNIDRLNNAIEHFSSDNLSFVNIGLIEFQEIAKTHFIDTIIKIFIQKLQILNKEFNESLDQDKINHIRQIHTNIFSVLFIDEDNNTNPFLEYLINLKGIDFIGYDYKSLNLSNANMNNNKLRSSQFYNVRFPEKAHMTTANTDVFFDVNCYLSEEFEKYIFH